MPPPTTKPPPVPLANPPAPPPKRLVAIVNRRTTKALPPILHTHPPRLSPAHPRTFRRRHIVTRTSKPSKNTIRCEIGETPPPVETLDRFDARVLNSGGAGVLVERGAGRAAACHAWFVAAEAPAVAFGGFPFG